MGKSKIKYIFKGNIIKVDYIFFDCENIQKLNLSSFNTQNVTNMYKMFYECNFLSNLNLTPFNTQNVTDKREMFCRCNSLIKKIFFD